MAKVVRNILIALVGVFAMLFAGFFIAGCGVDYSKIYLTNDCPEGLNLIVGDDDKGTDYVEFTINGYQKGFSNRVQIQERGQQNVFSATYQIISETKIRVTVTAVSGGTSQLVLKTLEGAKESIVNVNVKQYSKAMTFGGGTLYVSGGQEGKGGTPFVPEPSIFNFDSNTTEKDTLFYLVEKRNALDNIDDLRYVKNFSVDEERKQGTATLTNNLSTSRNDVNVNLTAFDKAELDNEQNLVFSLKGEEVENISIKDTLFVKQSKFTVLAAYEPSIDESEVISEIVSVNILPSLDVKFYGTYIDMKTSSQTIETLDFQEITSDEKEILIVPNNPKMTDYVVKVEMAGISADTPININKIQTSNLVDFDRFYPTPATGDEPNEDGNVISYWKISQSSQKQNEVTVGLNIFYEVAKQVFGDDSVNTKQNFNVKIMIAPEEIRINGQSDTVLQVYNVYDDQIYPNGYVYFSIDVISNFGSMPNVDGLWFDFDSDLDAAIGGTSLRRYNNPNNLLSNWEGEFKVRAISSTAEGSLDFTIHAVSKGGQNGIIYQPDETSSIVSEISKTFTVQVVSGASEIKIDGYQDKELYVDFEEKNIDFSSILFANADFKDVRVEFKNGTNVLNFTTIKTKNSAAKHEEGQAEYWLNLEITPLRPGTGVYDFYLDNGTAFKGLIFHCSYFLKEETTAFQFTSTGNSSVTKAEFSSTDENLHIQDVVDMEILNASTKDEVYFGSTASFTFKGNYTSIIAPSPTDVIGVTTNRADWTFVLTTKSNGSATLKFQIEGQTLDTQYSFSAIRKVIEFTVNVSSYSLISEFYLKNGANYALENTVYYGTGDVGMENSSVTLTPYAYNSRSSNFYRYTLDGNSISTIFNSFEGQEAEGGLFYYSDKTGDDSVIKLEYVKEEYRQEYLYFTFTKADGSFEQLSFQMRITQTKNDKMTTRRVVFNVANGLMFYLPESKDYTVKEGDDTVEYTVEFARQSEFTNEFVANYGTFNPQTLEFKYSPNFNEGTQFTPPPFVISAYLRQPNSTKRYDATIIPQEYIKVRSISRASGTENIDFTNERLSQSVGVLTTPTYATNNSIRVEFIPTVYNEYSSSMLTWVIDSSQKNNGIYTISLSVENFFKNHRDEIIGINDDLSGKLYIYPAEWGTSYTSLSSSQNPVCLNIQYRNGSRLNPYLLSSAQDVIDIGKNETTLNSHYELRETISMGAVNNVAPIGILEGEIVGFSGTIVGSTSDAAITDIIIGNGHFSKEIDGKLYAGLFAKINARDCETDTVDDAEVSYILPSIENVAFSGRFDNLTASQTSYIGLLTAINQGTLVNVGITIEKYSYSSSIIGGNGSVYFGTVAGLSYSSTNGNNLISGEIVQDFSKYNEDNYFRQYSGDLKEEDEKKYFNETINGIKYKYYVDESGFVVDAAANRMKFKQITVNNTKYYLPLRDAEDFSRQTPKTLAFFRDFVNITTENGNVYAGGVVGATNSNIYCVKDDGVILFGYGKYAAYLLIDVSGQTDGNVYAGGVAGVMSYVGTGLLLPDEGKIDVNTQPSFKFDNLLVGGTIDAMDISRVSSTEIKGGIGGIAGIAATASNREDIFISNNTVRTFLRGMDYVGAVVGVDGYTNTQGKSVYFSSTTAGSTGDTPGINTIEAVDAGAGVFESSMIIRQTSGALVEAIEKEESETDKLVLAGLIGNAYINGRAYNRSFKFETGSYLSRELRKIDKESGNTTLDAHDMQTGFYYGDILIVNKYNGDYVYSASYTFAQKTVELSIGNGSPFKMKGGSDDNIEVYFMYYFSVQKPLEESDPKKSLEESDPNKFAFAQDEINDLNYVSTNSNFHPLKPTGDDGAVEVDTDITISTASSILNVDANANITVKNTGLAKITVSSILNVVKAKTIYIFVVNYFNKNIQSSLFFAENSLNSVNLNGDSTYTLRGNKNSKLYLVPNYSYYNEGDKFNISDDGILNYKSKNYVLNPNMDLTVSVSPEAGTFSKSQVDGQTVVFYKKDKNSKPSAGTVDTYNLTPVLQIVIDGVRYYFELDGSALNNLKLTYRESAQRIYTGSTMHRIVTNQTFADTVTVESTNNDEKIYYRVTKVVENSQQRTIQEKLDENFTGDYLTYLNDDANDLFDFTFAPKGTNVYSFVCGVNKNSQAYKNRYSEPIYGEYILEFRSSTFDDNGGAVWCSTRIFLDEAELKFIGINNYSSINDVSTTAEVVVPSQRGLLEITLDPVEAVFDTFTISNNAANYNEGATEISLSFAYETVDENKSVTYQPVPNFGIYKNGALTFTYAQMINFLNSLSTAGEECYRGKIYISYIMPASNVMDKVPVGFDVSVTYGDEEKDEITEERMYYTKLGSYARLEFASKNAIDNVYYVARGLEYNLVLNSFGFEENQITITSSNQNVAQIVNENGALRLQITPNSIVYPQGYPGLNVTITTSAYKIVDNVRINSEHKMELCVMDFVMNYNYSEGVNEDLIVGMVDGVISTTIGNPYRLELSIANFIEYDTTNTSVAQSVNNFVTQMTNHVVWTAHEVGLPDVYLGDLTEIYRSNYFLADGLTITPLRVYNHELDAYHFSVLGYYIMESGAYIYSPTPIASERFYTEFSFDVKEQSTEESPLPIEKPEEFMNMMAGQWYILLNDITLTNNEQASKENIDQFTPITAQIAGFDGNGHEIYMGGEYNMETLAEIGLFANVREGCVIKNVTISLTSNVTIKVALDTYNVGLLAASNEGIITNANIKSNGKSLSVVYSGEGTATGSYVSSIAASNSGMITNSRSDLDIFANVNLTGFVGTNSGKIASSYYRGGSLENYSTGTSELTAGFVIENSGEIYTSYVSGDFDPSTTYYNGKENALKANNNIAGFVYENSGTVTDCYTNINMEGNGSYVAGFTITNSGEIDRCISWSVLINRNDSGYGFAGMNELAGEEDEGGSITNCYFLQDAGVNENIGNLENDPNAIIKPLTLKEFELGEKLVGQEEVDPTDNFATLFEKYNYQTRKGANAVWFYNDETNTSAPEFGDAKFNIKRLELVAPNIIAFSQRKLESVETVVDPETNAENVVYNYVYDSSVCEPLGEIHNPITISSPSDFENYVSRQNNSVNVNKAYYRFISDIQYDEDADNSKLSQTRFLGYLEGNFMEINGIKLVSSNKQNFAGMFAEIGSSSDAGSIGVVMNLTINPNEVNFSNAAVVGTLAGRLVGGKVYNVNVVPEDEIVVQGMNIVGGIVGMSTGEFDVSNVNSSAFVRAKNLRTQDFQTGSSDYSAYSYAGTIIGVASGRGKVGFSSLNNEIRVSAARPGLMFGLVDTGVTVSDMEVTIFEQTRVVSYNDYAGLFVGQTRGNISRVSVYGSDLTSNPFEVNNTSYLPKTVGGFAGIVEGGNLDNIYVSQDIIASTASTKPYDEGGRGIKYIGGFAGQIVGNAVISNIVVDNVSITGTEFVGGVAGLINLTRGGSVEFSNLDVSANLIVKGLAVSQAGVGGLAGEVAEQSNVVLSVTNKESDEIINNKFVIEGSIQVLVYQGGNNSYYIGAILGKNDKSNNHIIENTESTISGSSSLTNVSKLSDGADWTENLKTNKAGNLVTLDHTSTSTTKTVNKNIYNAKDSTYATDLSFVLNESDLHVYVSMFGSAKAF